jgi:hypothetical protein
MSTKETMSQSTMCGCCQRLGEDVRKVLVALLLVKMSARFLLVKMSARFLFLNGGWEPSLLESQEHEN